MTGIRTALVTGAAGFIGSALVRRLLAENIQVTSLVRDSTRAKTAIGNPQPAFIEVPQWSHENLTQALAGVSAEAVFHLASYGVQAHERDPEQLIQGNVHILTDVLKAVSHGRTTRFIFAGTCAEYGFPEHDQVPISETQPLRPTSPYGAAKAAAENDGAELAAPLNVPFITLRLFNVFGPGEAPARLLPFVIDHLQRHEPAELTGGEQVRDFIYLDDAVSALITAASAKSLNAGEAYNVCSGRGTSVRNMGEMAADVMGKPRSLLLWGKRPYRNDEPMWLVGDNRRFTQATLWQPQISLEEGIRRTISAAEHAFNKERQHAL